MCLVVYGGFNFGTRLRNHGKPLPDHAANALLLLAAASNSFDITAPSDAKR